MNSLRSKAQHSPEICRSSLPVKSLEEVQQEGSRSTSNIQFILCDQDAEAKVLVQQQSAVSRNYHEDWERRKASYRIFEDTTTPAQLDSWPKSTQTLLVVTSLPMRVSDTPFFKSAPWRSLELRSGLGGAHQDQTLVPGGYWTSVQQFDETYFKSMGLGLGRQGVEEFLGISGPSIPQAETSPEASRALANVLLPFQLLDLILSWSEMKTRTSGSHPEIPPRSIDVLSPRCMKPIYDKLVKWPNILSTAIKCREKMVGKKKSGQKEVTPANPVKQFLAFAKRIGTNVRADASITNLEHASWLLSWMMLGHSRLPDLSELQDVLWSRANKLGLNLTKEELLGGLPMAIDVGKLSLALKFALQLTPVVLLLDVVLVKQSISVTEQHEVWRALGFKNTPILQAVEEVIMSGVCEMIREGITAEAALNSILSHEAIQTAMGLPPESPEYSRFGTANISYIPIGKDLLTRVLVLSQAQPPSLPGPQSPHVRSNPFDDGLLTFSPRTTPSSPLIDLHLVGKSSEITSKSSSPPTITADADSGRSQMDVMLSPSLASLSAHVGNSIDSVSKSSSRQTTPVLALTDSEPSIRDVLPPSSPLTDLDRVGQSSEITFESSPPRTILADAESGRSQMDVSLSPSLASLSAHVSISIDSVSKSSSRQTMPVLALTDSEPSVGDVLPPSSPLTDLDHVGQSSEITFESSSARTILADAESGCSQMDVSLSPPPLSLSSHVGNSTFESSPPTPALGDTDSGHSPMNVPSSPLFSPLSHVSNTTSESSSLETTPVPGDTNSRHSALDVLPCPLPSSLSSDPDHVGKSTSDPICGSRPPLVDLQTRDKPIQEVSKKRTKKQSGKRNKIRRVNTWELKGRDDDEGSSDSSDEEGKEGENQPPPINNPENANPLQPASLSAEREIQIPVCGGDSPVHVSLRQPSDHEWKLLDSVILSNKASLYLSGESDGSSSSAIVVLEPKEWLQEDSFRLLGKSHILVHSLMAAHDSLPLVIDTLTCMGNPMERVLVIEGTDEITLSPCQRSQPTSCWKFDTGHIAAAHCKSMEGYSAHDLPTDQTRWFSIGTANTRCPAHVSHMATVLVVEDGVILLCISKPKPKPGRRFFVELLPEMTLVEQLDWEMVLLPAQSVFFLQPSTPYFYYNIQSSLVRGFGLFTVPNMLDSICGVYRKCVAAPSELVLTLPRLSRIFSFWFVNLKLRDQGDPLSHFIDRHLPDLQRWEDFLTMISLGNVLLLADALDLRSYDSVGWESSQVERSERALSVDHVVGFRAWALERYRLTRRESAENNVLEWAFASIWDANCIPGVLVGRRQSSINRSSPGPGFMDI
ncbi:hypothetical protein B0H11DRAFT_1905090 [Mycena galericulata]|nr:hypothetical protein B0H11DRAFT_1905090 [Mycena galericulata]